MGYLPYLNYQRHTQKRQTHRLCAPTYENTTVVKELFLCLQCGGAPEGTPRDTTVCKHYLFIYLVHVVIISSSYF